ncbi:hypothetical protein BH10PLA2_BH10PLA2_21420 [soil metagenome]
MKSIVLRSMSGADGKLHLEVPVGQADMEFEVELFVRPSTTAREFPPGYFDLLGSVDDDTLTIHPQPPLPPSMEVD